jgi:hypothetical protein
MGTKLTLRLDEELIENAKREARSRGTSVSKMVAAYFRGLEARKRPVGGPREGLGPVTASLLGALKGEKMDPADYRRRLEEKHR